MTQSHHPYILIDLTDTTRALIGACVTPCYEIIIISMIKYFTLMHLFIL